MALKISRILHAGYVFGCDGVSIAVDPVFENPFSRNCHAFPAVKFDVAHIKTLRFDAVFISHFHDDHCSLESLDLLHRDTTIYLYCLFEPLFALIRELGFRHVAPLAIDAPVSVGAITVTARRALDDDVDSMLQISAGGVNLLNVVDASIAPQALPALASLAPWDMVLWPFQTMLETDVIAPSRALPLSPGPSGLPALPDEWFEQLAALRPRYVVPSSCQFVQEPWSWYNHAMFPVTYRQFQHDIEAALPGVQVVRFNPSVSMWLSAADLTPADALPWVIPVGEQELDFEYDPGRTPPTTADVARHFSALTAQQSARVLRYCHTELLEKYRAMELDEDSYFQQPRTWQLSLLDHDGAATRLRYQVKGDTIALLELDDNAAPLSWCTEIPMAKLYAGLEWGESLTSMYMRINDAVFDAQTEADIASAELVDDPLIRCLFNDAFGAYQAAQLRRIRQRA